MVVEESPIQIYRDVPYGDSRPESYTAELERRLAMDHLSPETKRKITDKHPYVWGMDYWSTKLDDGDNFSVTVTNNLGFHRGVVRIEGLEGPNPNNPNVFYGWQSGLTKVEDYYFYTEEGGLRSILDLVASITEKDVELYYYDPNEARGASPRVASLKRDNGQDYYAVFVHNPKTLTDIVGMIHELGHIVAIDRHGDKYKAMLENLQNDPDWQSAAEEFNGTVTAWGEDEPTREARMELYRRFYTSLGFEKRQDIEMITEVDAWSAAIDLIHRLGLNLVLDPSSDDFTNNMWWAIKTRIPNLSEETEED